MDTLQKISPLVIMIIAVINILLLLFAFFGNLATKDDVQNLLAEMNRRTEAFERRTDLLSDKIDKAVEKSHAQQPDHISTYHAKSP